MKDCILWNGPKLEWFVKTAAMGSASAGEIVQDNHSWHEPQGGTVEKHEEDQML